MGSTGGLINKPTSDTDKYTVFGIGDNTSKQAAYKAAKKWFANPKLSNATKWETELLSPSEKSAIESYTGVAYEGVNDDLYDTPWDDMSLGHKQTAQNIYNGLNKFELNHGITVTRTSDYKIFGGNDTKESIINFLNQSGGILQNDGFLSFGANSDGISVSGSGLIINLKVPPSKGAGAYVNNISWHEGAGENEFLLNSNAILKFDVNSLKKTSKGYAIEAEWLGQAKSQTIDPKNKSKYAKKK